MKRNITVIKDVDGKDIIVINDIRFKGKRNIDWDEVKKYLEEYVGDFYTIASSDDVVFIGREFPDEYTGSKYTYGLKGAVAKAKANASQGIPEMIEIATNKSFKENRKPKHNRDAGLGWYKYDSRFALPVYDSNGEIERYNVYYASMIIRHDIDGKKYLYDVLNIRKEASNPFNA